MVGRAEEAAVALVYEWACCDHCGCPKDDRIGHDDTCASGCNDQQLREAGYGI